MYTKEKTIVFTIPIFDYDLKMSLGLSINFYMLSSTFAKSEPRPLKIVLIKKKKCIGSPQLGLDALEPSSTGLGPKV